MDGAAFFAAEEDRREGDVRRTDRWRGSSSRREPPWSRRTTPWHHRRRAARVGPPPLDPSGIQKDLVLERRIREGTEEEREQRSCL